MERRASRTPRLQLRKKRAAERLRLKRPPPRGVSRAFYEMFGELDPAICTEVAEYVDQERRRVCVEVALLEIGSRDGFGFSLTKGFEVLRAGRYLALKKRRNT